VRYPLPACDVGQSGLLGGVPTRSIRVEAAAPPAPHGQREQPAGSHQEPAGSPAPGRPVVLLFSLPHNKALQLTSLRRRPIEARSRLGFPWYTSSVKPRRSQLSAMSVMRHSLHGPRRPIRAPDPEHPAAMTLPGADELRPPQSRAVTLRDIRIHRARSMRVGTGGSTGLQQRGAPPCERRRSVWPARRRSVAVAPR
jgi:hypothetical protein